MRISILVALIFTIIGCATRSRSLGFGGAVGATSGALLGGIVDPGRKGEFRTRNVIVGAALGGMAGAASASLIQKQNDQKAKDSFLAGQKATVSTASGSMPMLSSPRVETHWVEGRVIGNRYIEGHFEYEIVEPSRWDVK